MGGGEGVVSDYFKKNYSKACNKCASDSGLICSQTKDRLTDFYCLEMIFVYLQHKNVSTKFGLKK